MSSKEMGLGQGDGLNCVLAESSSPGLQCTEGEDGPGGLQVNDKKSDGEAQDGQEGVGEKKRRFYFHPKAQP